jgi:hypothetical protein
VFLKPWNQERLHLGPASAGKCRKACSSTVSGNLCSDMIAVEGFRNECTRLKRGSLGPERSQQPVSLYVPLSKEPDTVMRTGHAASPRGVALRLCLGSPLRAEIEALDPTGLEAATDAAAAMVAERCGEGAFETQLQALVVETTR